jgi:2'-5' RNA ligase
MSHSRLFLAIPLSAVIRKDLDDLMSVFRGKKGINVTTVENLHITVHFYGNVEDETIQQLTNYISGQLEGLHSFRMQLDQLLYFPPRRIRMIWATFLQSPAFTRLSDLFQQPESSEENSNPKEQTPHITCARLKHVSDTTIPLPALQRRIIQVDCIELWKSTSTPTGVKYSPIASFPLSTS